MRARTAKRCAVNFALTSVLSAWWSCALALDPALDMSQYGHASWKIRDGFPKDTVAAFAQTSDGYLWLGTNSGLLRFDGVRSVAWQAPAGTSLPDNHIRALLAARDGTLWIGTARGLASWREGRLATYPQLNGRVDSLAEDQEGTVWVAVVSNAGMLCAIRGINTECHGDDGRFGGWAGSFHEDRKGALWATSENGVWRWRPGAPVSYSLPAVSSFQALGETATGAILAVTRNGLRQIADDKVTTFPIPSPLERMEPSTVFRDRDGTLWFGTQGQGLFHVHDERVDKFARVDGFSGDTVGRLFEDHEGNVWATTNEGVDRFRPLAAATYSVGQGLSGLGVSVLPDRDGGIWVVTTKALHRWHDRRMTAYRGRRDRASPTVESSRARGGTIDVVYVDGLPEVFFASLFQDARGRVWVGATTGLGYLDNGRFTLVRGVSGGYIDAITEDSKGNLWIAHRGMGLLRLSRELEVLQVPWAKFGSRGPAKRLVFDPVRGGLWLGFWSGGIAHFIDGGVRAGYGAAEGLGDDSVNDLRVGPAETLWVATEGGLSRLKSGHIATLRARDGLPCDAVDSTIDDDDAFTWIYTACGLVRIARSDLDAWADAVDNGQPPPKIRTMILDSLDGVRNVGVRGTSSPHIAKSRDGKLWLTTHDGLTVVDPRHLPFNKLPPPVHVEQIVADRKTYEASSQLHLPPLVRDLQIDYTALSFIVPEKVLFRYKLEGRDRDWQDAGNRRQAFYSDLDPGNYRFRVIAANNSGVWNEEGASLDFSIAPAYWQTNWFRALCVVVIIAVLWALYLLRVRHLARQFNMTLDARVNERTRIARELHDTLLQSFHGLLLRFQTALKLLPSDATEARDVLTSAIRQSAAAITEGRDSVQGLRTSATESNDLVDAIRSLGQELVAEGGNENPPTLRIEAQGEPRTLHPIVRDEIFRLTAEALRNAFRHAQAKQIEVNLRYDARQLRLIVGDDGKGIDPDVLRAGGREGHFGLRGIRERAKHMGGKLTVWSALDTGTEIELSIPASHAYAASRSGWRSRFAETLFGQATTIDR